MPVNVKTMSDMIGKDVFTTKGVFAGRISDVHLNLGKFRIHSLVLDVGRNSFLSNVIGNKRGVIVPYPYVETVGDVVIIKHVTANTPAPVVPEPAQTETASPFSMF
jgi:sporulation protein YlmC with PRC-barrel domain